MYNSQNYKILLKQPKIHDILKYEHFIGTEVYSVSEKTEKAIIQAVLLKIAANESVMPGEPAIYRVGVLKNN